MTYTKESFIRRLEEKDHVEQVGDLGNSVVAFETVSKDMSAYGALIADTEWTITATDWNQRAVFFAPIREVQNE
ncbi:hypothetical protein [Natrinema versiforme]|uniref:Uncharacterized protein n=1 Tax=Natrinema versiforme JCM 10478 TaxID=1227496 RepID=L9Y8S1_9EURY|nr:hypothetical protein [Natrinema versiforme]ELY69318.1 hypothetical protein C489_05173 [Natrinema versiforme JCM 10478]